MIKKKNEGSVLIDFQPTSNSQRLFTVADNIISEFDNTGKHIPRKRQILVTLITNLIFNFLRGYSTAIPRGKKFYSNIPKRYRPEFMSYKIIIDFIDNMLKDNKYVIEKYRAQKNEYGEASKYEPSDLLVSMCEEPFMDNYSLSEEECILLRKKIPVNLNVSNGMITQNVPTSNQDEVEDDELNAEETITAGLEDEGQLTKNYMKILVPYAETEYTQRIRSDLKEYNRFRIQNSITLKELPASMLFNNKYNENIQKYASVDISKLQPETNGNFTVPLLPDNLVRIFTSDFEHGGRFYRGFETQLKKELRPYIAINDCSTVEYDYSSYHIRMIYHLNNKRCPEDPYVPFKELDPDEGRDYYKTMVAACLNNSSEKSVLKTMRHYITKKELRDYFSDITDAGLKKGLELLTSHNRLVARHFFHSDGLIYHRIDSDIANDILMYFTRLKIPELILCIHDSFIIAQKHGDKLKWAMNKFYRAKVHKYPTIK